ncbi:UNKNOWN [Stylonychia lemnae]|uniref:Uncharacterized protein n=1 Tax=Stylonychia lemnae TaxID=5949 RepID=A0A078AVF7_STYLE|nr:UNKNOWN [Stylonychia lemnae]|eukprot:CDW86365.1 UNKNOWN [Stylonychia lemnae]
MQLNNFNVNDENDKYSNHDDGEYDPSMQTYADSRVVKTVRNLKRISSATPKKNISGTQLPTTDEATFINQQFQQPQIFQPQQRGTSGGSYKSSVNNGADSSFVDPTRVVRVMQQQPMIRNSQAPQIFQSNTATQNSMLQQQQQYSMLQQSNQLPKKDETVEERIRRIRSKNAPNPPPQDENIQKQHHIMMHQQTQIINAQKQNNLAGLQLQKMNSAMGTQSSKSIPNYSLQQNGQALNQTRTNTNSMAGNNGTNVFANQSQVNGKSMPLDNSWISENTNNQSFIRNAQQQQLNSKNSQVNGKLPSSKSTTADTDLNNINSQQQFMLTEDPYFQQQQMNQQMGPIRGVNPESNINLQNDQILLDSKRDKCIELMRNSTAVHDIIQKFKSDPQMSQVYNLDLNALVQIMFQDRHFTNLLTIELAKKQGANKLEKFIAEKLQDKLKSMHTEIQIRNKLESVNRRLQDRLERLKRQMQ